MESFYISYRDPLFGIISFFLIILIISVTSYVWGIFKSSKEKDKIDKFVSKFSLVKDYKFQQKVLHYKELSDESLIMLAYVNKKNGEYEKAILVYLALLNRVSDNSKKAKILVKLAQTYKSAGLLHRARDVYLEKLSFSPRDKDSLKDLLLIYEKLQLFNEAKETIEVLEELGVDISEAKEYLSLLEILHNKNIDEYQKSIELYKNLDKKIFQRAWLDFCINNKIEIDIKKILKFDIKLIWDILWSFDIHKLTGLADMGFTDEIFLDIIRAHRIIDDKKGCKIFELELYRVMRDASSKRIEISFEYGCKSCNTIYPLYFYRCPKCSELNCVSILPQLSEKTDAKNISFL